MATHQVVLDTDIGSDVDDALALAMLLGSPDVDLLGVTTVYGDVETRARIARRLARLAGHDALPVAAGAETPLSGEDPWWAGFEGRLYADLGAEAYMEDVPAADFLTETVAARPGEVSVVAIGPLTNIAEAIQAEPEFAQSVRHLYVMGGRFDSTEPEHNFKSDAEAAARVFESDIPVTVVGLEITTKARIEPDDLARIATAGALGRQLEAEVRQWWQFVGQQWNNPHDPLAVLAMVRPDLLGTRPAAVRIEREGDLAGSSRADGATDGPAHVVTSIDVPAAVSATVSMIEAAGRRGPS